MNKKSKYKEYPKCLDALLCCEHNYAVVKDLDSVEKEKLSEFLDEICLDIGTVEKETFSGKSRRLQEYINLQKKYQEWNNFKDSEFDKRLSDLISKLKCEDDNSWNRAEAEEALLGQIVKIIGHFGSIE